MGDINTINMGRGSGKGADRVEGYLTYYMEFTEKYTADVF